MYTESYEDHEKIIVISSFQDAWRCKVYEQE